MPATPDSTVAARLGPYRPLFTAVATGTVVGLLLIPGPAIPSIGFAGTSVVAHLLLFFGWAVIVQWEFALAWPKVLVVGVAFAVATEVLQIAAVERTFSVSDIVTDVLGVGLGATAVALWRRRSFQAGE